MKTTKPLMMKKSFLLTIAVLLLLVSSCDFVRDNNPFTKKERQRALQVQIENARIADSLQKVHALEAEMKAVQDSLASMGALTEVVNETTNVNDNGQKYHIIVGSFITPAYAEGFSDYYAAKGYQTTIIDMPDSRFKLVSAGSYSTVSEAWNAVKSFRDTVEFDSWVYVRK